MGCFPCAGGDSSAKKSPKNKRIDNTHNDQSNNKTADIIKVEQCDKVKKENAPAVNQTSVSNGFAEKNKPPEEGSPMKKARTFTYAQLVNATDNFKAAYFLGEGGFGKVYKGKFEDSDQILAIKQLDPDGLQGIREFVVEVLTLSMADHPNLVKLIGYCAEGEQRLLVYEYMPLGSLEDHLHDKTHVSTRVMGTYGYCAPDYAMTGQLTFKSDIYSFGVVLLELITGRKAIDDTRSAAEQNLVAWARPLFKDRRKFPQMADPVLEGEFPVRGLYQALAISAMCVQEQPNMRPLIADVVTALNYLASQNFDPLTNPAQHSRRSSRGQRSIDENKPDS
ncbi:hypothetical protein E3N88_25213 [Mikania micrantha]|uniref:Protein kinase domain-containing protein n=1 Tax=Mikania micrantha TaxID=192012 RepID=A0A5N6N453_9ASTR|nr:hypothetical protein E3N88_25213 [Mikania micrantha]